MGEPVGSQFWKMVRKFKTVKLHSRIVNSTCINQVVLPKKNPGKTETSIKYGFQTYFRLKNSVQKKKRDFLFRCSVAPGNFPLEREKKPCSIFFSARFSRDVFKDQGNVSCHLFALSFPKTWMSYHGTRFFFVVVVVAIRIYFTRISRLKIAKS